MRVIVLAAAVTGALALAAADATPASANGRFPASNQIAFSPSNPNLIVLRATFGILVSRDDGTTWDWLCEDALGIAPTQVEDPSVGVTASNAIIAGLRGGLDVSPDTGCNWAYTGGPLSQQAIYDVVVRPNQPDAVLAGSSTFEPDAGEAGATSTYDNQLFQSLDDGANWAPLGVPFDPGLIATTFDVAGSDPNRLYAAGYNDNGSTRTFAMVVSTNGAAQWSEVAIPLDPSTEEAAFIATVDPTDADRVYVRSEGSPSRLFVTENAGQTFQPVFSLTNDISGFALSPDGGTVYAGSMKDGLYAGPGPGTSLQKVSSIQVGCLAARAGELWACSTEASGFVVGVSTDNGATFTPKLHLEDIRGPIACGADATAAVCATSTPAFSSLCTILNECFATGPLTPESDGGAPSPMSELCRSGPNCPCETVGNCYLGGDASAGTDAGPTTKPATTSASRKGICGCSVVGGGGGLGFAGSGVLAVIAARRRRRRPRAATAKKD
jgi:MYXO-CTERM domain-containing protein